MNLFVLVSNLFKAGVSCWQSLMEGMPEKNKIGPTVHVQKMVMYKKIFSGILISKS